jgi:hypothetical protein
VLSDDNGAFLADHAVHVDTGGDGLVTAPAS